MPFEEVIGQHPLKGVLSASLESGHIAHASLFAGKTGYGTFALAMEYAQNLLCRDFEQGRMRADEGVRRRVLNGTHPDIHFVFPVVRKGASSSTTVSSDFIKEWREFLSGKLYFSLSDWVEKMGGDENAQPMIYVAESAEIMKALVLKPYEADCRVFVIWLPERMNEECANKLLKVLEEPYPGTFFLLVSELPEKLLPTILSRVQRINVPAIDRGEVAAFLKSEYRLSESSAERIAAVAEGDVVKASALLAEDSDRDRFLDLFQRLMRLCWTREMVSVNRWVTEMADAGRERQKRFLEYAAGMIRDNFIKNLGESELVNMTEGEEQFSVRFSPFVNESNVIPLYDAMDQAFVDISRNGNSKIILTDFCIKVMQNIRPNK